MPKGIGYGKKGRKSRMHGTPKQLKELERVDTPPRTAPATGRKGRRAGIPRGRADR
jgi:hypothetical protein